MDDRLGITQILQSEVVMDSSPGVPYMRLARRNKDIVQSEELSSFVVRCVCARVRLLLRVEPEELAAMLPSELVERGFADPIKIFIKSEPHKLQKIREGKLRIISNVSLVDQIIERLLSTPQNKLEIRRWATCPSKPGMGLNDSGLQELYSTLQQKWREGAKLAESDVSGWDWSIPYWLLKMDAEARVRLANASNGPWAHLVRCRVEVLARKLFYLSDGQMWEQTVPGVQASGSFNTSSTNSRMRVMVGWVEGQPWVMAMGDDDVEEEGEEVPDYGRRGLRVKEYKECVDGVVEFCSTRFPGSWKGYPTQVGRMLFRLLSHSSAVLNQHPEFKAQFLQEVRHHPEKAEIEGKVDSIIALLSKPCQQ